MNNKVDIKEKKVKLVAIFSAIYTFFFSLGVTCFIGAFFTAVGSSMDHIDPWKAYPHYMPFCVITGQIALAVLVIAFIVNIILSIKSGMTFKSWLFVFLCPIVLLAPMVFVWNVVFGILGSIF